MDDVDVFAGIIASDGHLGQDRNTIFVINSDIEFLEKIAIPIIHRLTGKEVKPKSCISGFGKQKYKINVSSAKLWKLLNTKYNIPQGAKSLSIQPPKLDQLEEKNGYLGGWIAGDGSVTVDRTRAKIEIWSKSEAMINWFSSILQENSIETRVFKERVKDEYILRVGKKSEVLKFYNKIRIPHPRKQRRLEFLLSSRPFSN